jgi:hypothetical protein
MVVMRALLYAVAIFVALGVISLIVAVIMRIMYGILHKGEKANVEDKADHNMEAKINSR